MKKRIIAGNWKMHKTPQEAHALLSRIVQDFPDERPSIPEVVIIPPSLYLERFKEEITPPLRLGAQNCHHENEGPYTGEIGPAMLAALNIEYCIVGHSERREHFGEDNGTIAKKARALLNNGVSPIICCGERLNERERGEHSGFVKEQLSTCLEKLSEREALETVIAYEPIWAIGTGHTAKPEQIAEMHTFIRETLKERFTAETAKAMPILYGGSCKPENASDVLSTENVDGGLIGGASLDAEQFLEIIRTEASL